ncbi:zinc knuckle CX2CX4HX4C containing protein [Tanacetum coccineum]
MDRIAKSNRPTKGFMKKLVSTRDIEGKMGQCKADEFRALGGESTRVEYPSFGVAQGVSLADFNPVSINVVYDFFKVSLLTPVDIDNFIRVEVWSMLTKEQRDGVIDIVGVLLDSLLSDDNDITREKPSQVKVHSNFCTLVAEPICDGVNISIPPKVVKKVSLRFEHTLYGYFIGKRIAFPVVEYFVRNNWAKHGLTQIMMNSKGFFFFKFKSHVGLEAVFEGGPWLIRKSPIILKKWSMDTRLHKEDLTRQSSFARCLIEVNSKADLVDVVTEDFHEDRHMVCSLFMSGDMYKKILSQGEALKIVSFMEIFL